jgi:hypothetical protein
MASQERDDELGFQQPVTEEPGQPGLAPTPATASPSAEPGAPAGQTGGTADLVGGGTDAGDAQGQGTAGTVTESASDTPPLLPQDESERFRGQWERIQAGFVDEPRSSVEQADQLVADLMRQLAERFSQQRSSLEAEWGRGDDVSTEDLRVTLQQYRSFFQRLLAA